MPVGLSCFQRRRIFQPKKQKKRQAQSRGCWNVPPLKRLFGTMFFCVYGKSAVNKLYNIKVFEVTFMEYLFYHFFF